jgi:multiple sugar transport system substrate-binding protein
MKFWHKAAFVAAAIIGASSQALAVENVVWWDFITGGDGVRLKALIEKFNDEHKDTIHITGTTLDWGGPFYTKLLTSAAIGKGPDIATYHLSRIQTGVASKTLAPIDPKDLESIGLHDGDYPARAIDAATVDGKRYAVPFDVHATVLYYNKKVLSDLKLLDENGRPKGIDTLDGWRATLEKIKAAGDIGVTFEANKADVRIVYTLFGQKGGSLVTDGKFLQGDNFDKMLAAFDEVTSWVSKGWCTANMEDVNQIAAFTSGQAAFMLTGDWQLPTMADLKAKGSLDYGMMEVPAWFGKPASWADSHGFILPNNVGKPAAPKTHAAVLEIIKWMNQNSLSWAGAGHIPAYLPVRESAEYKALKPQADYANVANDAFYEPKSKLTGADGEFEHHWAGEMSDPMNGGGGAKEALAKLRDYLNAL